MSVKVTHPWTTMTTRKSPAFYYAMSEAQEAAHAHGYVIWVKLWKEPGTTFKVYPGGRTIRYKDRELK